LDLSFDILNGACWLDFKGDGFTGEGFLDVLDGSGSDGGETRFGRG
jgi:hypothetical protein